VIAALLCTAPLSPATASASCGGGYYSNVDDHCVERPDYDPGTRDRDDTNSHSEHQPGSGSWHGGTGGGHHSRK
jgi:hypothetical protein